MRRAVFLDRDGVLNEPVMRDGKPTAPVALDEFKLVPGLAEDVKRIRDAGFLAIVFTNQPEVSRGLLKPEVLEAMNRQLPVDDVFVCPHQRSEGCDCRKPLPGMLFQARAKWDIDVSKSFVVGDRGVDIEAGRAVGAHTILIERPYSDCRTADDRVADLRSAVDIILR